MSIAVTDAQPPSEFCIFTAGDVETTKGTFLFDKAAAASVMAEYREHGIELMIDYDHASLSLTPLDPALASKAAGWFDLEVRNGELWAVNVRWTSPAAEALQRKEWRFMSPAFQTDEDGRVVSLLNVAITNMPATRRLDPLVAAGKKTIMASMDTGLPQKLISAALEAVASKDSKSSLDLLKQMLAALLGGGASDDSAPPSSGDGSGDPPSASDAPPATSSADKDEKDKQTMAGASRVAIALTGKSDPSEALAELARRSRVAVDLEAREVKLASDRAVLEGGERRGLVAQLVKLGVEIPGTAWSDDKGSVPCKRLASEPLDELRSRVAALSAAGVRPVSTVQVQPPSSLGKPANNLSDADKKLCAQMGCPEDVFIALRAQRDSVKVGT